MIKGEIFTPVAYFLMIFLSALDCFMHVNQLFMVFAFTCLIVYIGSIKSSKIYSKEVQASEIETMKQKDAWLFPVIGSSVLIGLFLLFKYLNKDYVNILFHVYFCVIGAYTIGVLIEEKICKWKYFKEMAEKHLFTVPKIPYFADEETKVYLLDIVCFLFGSVFGLIYFFKKYWFMNNLIGAAFCILGLESMMLGEFKVALILLVLLFFYDIIMVFYTPFMVGVAKNLDGPIKLMFPKVVNYSKKEDFNMIGLGDIVIPGIYVAFMLRFDMIKYFRKNKTFEGLHMGLGTFKYFFSTFTGYIVGIGTTLFIMVYFNHAQPALFYLVPGVLISSMLCCLINGDFKELWEINEEKLQDEFKGKKPEAEKKTQ